MAGNRDAEAVLSEQERQVLQSLETVCGAVEELAAERSRQKLSNSRVAGVAKELRELTKVLAMAVY